ncbi:unnamed protein product [Prunus armeniaca]
MTKKIHHLQSVLFTLKGDSRLKDIEEEVRLLWAASRSSTTSIFNCCLSGSKGHALTYSVYGYECVMADIVHKFC